MVFSKSFGYALRGILYVAAAGDKVHLYEIAERLSVPRHFLGKIMRNMVSQGILSSEKGSKGGFYINESTLGVSLQQLVEATGEMDEPGSCVLRLRKCNSANPCPLHRDIEVLKTQWQHLLANTTVEDLLSKNNPLFIQSIAI